MTREEAIARVKHQRDWANEVNRTLDVEAFEMAAKALEDVETLNAINLDLADENEDLIERIGKLIGYIDFLRNVGTGKKKSLDWLEKVVKGQIKEIRAEGENFVQPKVGEWIPVTERLPKAGEYVGNVAKYYLVQNEYGDMLVARYTHSECWEQMYHFKPISDEIVAWMPLPEPYKAGREESNG